MSFYGQVYLYDTCGMEQARTLTSNYYRNSVAVLLFYSVEALYTFEHLSTWADDAEGFAQKEASQLTWALIGNKCDLMQEINDETIQKFCIERLKTDLSFFVSTKSGENVINTFETIVAAAHRKQLELGTSVMTERSSTLRLHRITSSESKSKCSC